jgi:hypothetical protein
MRPESTRAPGGHAHASGNDEPYTVGRLPATYLTLREIARLMILRSKLSERLTAGTPRE